MAVVQMTSIMYVRCGVIVDISIPITSYWLFLRAKMYTRIKAGTENPMNVPTIVMVVFTTTGMIEPNSC